jgi:hypothetical protein
MASVERLEMALSHGEGSRPGPAAMRTQTATVDGDAIRVVADLNRPWPALFDAIEGARRPSVRVLHVGVDGRFSQLHLTLEARSLQDVIDYSESLRAQAPLKSVQLVQHEWRSDSGMRVLSARLVAGLSASAPAAMVPSGGSSMPLVSMRPGAVR